MEICTLLFLLGFNCSLLQMEKGNDLMLQIALDVSLSASALCFSISTRTSRETGLVEPKLQSV